MFQEFLNLGFTFVVAGDTRLQFGDNFRLKDIIDFLQIEEWQNQFFILQILFQGVELLDLVVDPVIDRIELGLGQIGLNSAVQENDSSDFDHRGMSPQPLAVFSLETKRLALLDKACRMPRHPLCLGQLHGLRKLG